MPGLGHLYCGRLFWGLIFWPLSFLGWGVFLIGWGMASMELAAVYPTFLTSAALVWIACAVHATICARRADPEYRLRGYNIWYFYLLLWFLGFSLPNYGLIKYVQANLLTTFVLSSDNMQPTLLPGDGIMVDRRQATLDNLERGAIVAALDPIDGTTVRFLRVVGLGGETLDLTPAGLLVDSQPIEQTIVDQTTFARKSNQGEWIDQPVIKVEEKLGNITAVVFKNLDPTARPKKLWKLAPEQLLLLGDNRFEPGATTVRPVQRQTILGRVFLIRWSKDPRTKTWRKLRRRIPVP
ncbi:MAG: signal peptidase I [Deltaproteobacteria bacterium]|nr:signal peptidase I [Deltaproteobacteria bacterium]